jgi:hypothetical protein
MHIIARRAQVAGCVCVDHLRLVTALKKVAA